MRGASVAGAGGVLRGWGGCQSPHLQGAGCDDPWLCRSECAILYNDRSVLENHHISSVFRMMQDDEMNIFINLTKDEFV